jgi:hypothetical protein
MVTAGGVGEEKRGQLPLLALPNRRLGSSKRTRPMSRPGVELTFRQSPRQAPNHLSANEDHASVCELVVRWLAVDAIGADVGETSEHLRARNPNRGEAGPCSEKDGAVSSSLRQNAR